jgi:DNA repair protein SbcD/Mre11
MSLKIFLTSDLHLGMKFAGYPEVQAELSEARFKALGRMVELANTHRCNLLVIAGDLFDRVTVAKRDVIRGAQFLKEFQGPLVAVLPGNHDFISRGQNDLWTSFRENAGDRILVLDEKKKYSLLHYDLEAMVYPAPCDSKHSTENAIGWIGKAPKDAAVKHHIGVAHGSLEGFSPDFEERYYPMTTRELLEYGMNLWLMGHTHAQYPFQATQTEKIFYPGTPEPDGFDCQHEGKAWILQLAEDHTVTPLSLSTGMYRFLHDELEIQNPSDLETLKKKYVNPGYTKTLLKMKLRGRLPREEYQSLSLLRKMLEEHLYYLAWNDAEVNEEITLEAIHREFTEDSFPHRLLTGLAQSDNSEALQIAYELLQELRARN